MRFRFVLPGAKYSRHKAAFKRLLKDHGLKWRGSMTEYRWESRKERVAAEFERDAAEDVTIRATLVWEGRAKTRFLNELKTWVFSLGGESEQPKASREDKAARTARLEEELAFWDRLHKPDVPALQAAGRPEDWIERDLRAWRKARETKRKELLKGG